MPTGTAKTVFIVDDDAAVRSACERALKTAGYQVLTARDGAEVSGIMNRASVDLLLVDIFMPEIDGFEVIQKVRERSPSVVIVAMSGGGAGFQADDVLHLCGRMGARAALSKPFTAEQLTNTIAAALGPF
jgi:DNA-binding NtrC family response regulator